MILNDNLNIIYMGITNRTYSYILFETSYEYNHNNGPALLDNEGYKIYYRNYRLHNEKGPAVIYVNGMVLYNLNGQKIT